MCYQIMLCINVSHNIWAQEYSAFRAFYLIVLKDPNELGFSYWATSFWDKWIIYDEEDDIF